MQIRYQDLLNKNYIKKLIKARVNEDSTLFSRVKFLESVEDDLEIQEYILHHEKQLVRYAKVGEYATAASRFINYCVRVNIPLKNFDEIIKSKTFKDQYISYLKEKQATIEFINDILPMLKKLDDYITKMSNSPEYINPDKGPMIKAQSAMRKLEERVKDPIGILKYLKWTSHRSIYYPNNKFSHNNTLNSIIVHTAKEVLKKEEEWRWEKIEPLMTIESIASTYRRSSGNLKVFGRSMLSLFIDLIQQYIREYHQDDLEAEKKSRRRKNDNKYYNERRNSKLATLEERKQVVLYLCHHLKNPTYKGIADILDPTQWKTSRGTVGRWIRKFYNGEAVNISDSISSHLLSVLTFPIKNKVSYKL